MRPRQARFVTACQQLLALGVVVAALTPAASVVSLDVIGQRPGSAPATAGRPSAGSAAYSREARRPSVLPDQVVDAEVEEYALTTAPGSRVPARSVQARTTTSTTEHGRESVVTSRPQPVTGYGAVGVTWDPEPTATDSDGSTTHEHGDDAQLGFEVRTFDDGTWSDWSELPHRDDHQPDPGSVEGRQARPGTEALLVGEVEQVQVRAVSENASPPAGLQMAVIAPGEPTGTTTERAAIDTGGSDVGEPSPAAAEGESLPVDGLDLQAATYTPRPKIYSRQQWGANERLRDKGSLRYYEVHAGFVHHTVNANGYSRDQVPGILRSIYAYHTQSRGWSDVGYNFLVDRFGRIWEGRAGGVDRPVVGAHTLGYNDYSFAMSAIGNFETATPRDAMLQAYGSLFAWKLSLHGVDASSDRQRVGGSWFRAINGHRDAGSTACPGRYLYARLGTIRRYADAAQRSWAGRELASDLAGTPHPDLIVRRASDGKAFIIP
ncbi:MAG: peptidoglycan recognition protein family protein, partial [Nocardioides sp.]